MSYGGAWDSILSPISSAAVGQTLPPITKTLPPSGTPTDSWNKILQQLGISGNHSAPKNSPESLPVWMRYHYPGGQEQFNTEGKQIGDAITGAGTNDFTAAFADAKNFLKWSGWNIFLAGLLIVLVYSMVNSANGRIA